MGALSASTATRQRLSSSGELASNLFVVSCALHYIEHTLTTIVAQLDLHKQARLVAVHPVREPGADSNSAQL